MEYKTIRVGELPVEASYSLFSGDGRDGEYHVVFTLQAGVGDAARQVACLDEAVRCFPAAVGNSHAILVWRRYYLSDAINQRQWVDASLPGALSLVGQPPLNGAKAVAWCYYVERGRVTRAGDTVILARPGREHHYYTGLRNVSCPDEGGQMRAIFHGLRDKSHGLGVDFSGEMIRTWIYVTDIDNRYARMVSARKAFFDEVGLTARTHYLASTGIEASAAFPGALVTADAYAVTGLLPGQVSFLRAADHLCLTDRYGVTFERGTVVAYGDRVHLFISGTASIDCEGALLFPGDVTAQARRAIQNVEALLREGGAGSGDVTYAIVYLRDAADRDAAAGVMEEWLPGVPTVHVRAAVCRPGWLVEIECSAIIPSSRAAFPPF